MKKRILIVGNNEYSRECYEDGVFKINKKKYINALYDKYEIDNLSKDNLSIESAIRMSKKFTESNEYAACIVALGLDELVNNKMDNFEENLVDLLSLLKSKNIEAILLEVDSENNNVNEINRIINNIKKKYGLDYDMFNDLIINNPKLQLC